MKLDEHSGVMWFNDVSTMFFYFTINNVDLTIEHGYGLCLFKGIVPQKRPYLKRELNPWATHQGI